MQGAGAGTETLPSLWNGSHLPEPESAAPAVRIELQRCERWQTKEVIVQEHLLNCCRTFFLYWKITRTDSIFSQIWKKADKNSELDLKSSSPKTLHSWLWVLLCYQTSCISAVHILSVVVPSAMLRLTVEICFELERWWINRNLKWKTWIFWKWWATSSPCR